MRQYKVPELSRINHELESNEGLRQGLKDLSLRSGELDKEQYISQLLQIFNREGFDLSVKELDMLLLLRQAPRSQGK